MAKIIKINCNTDIPVIFEQDNRLPLVSLQLVFRDSGSLADGKDGLAKLSGKLLSEGTKALGSIAFSTMLESRAVSLNASTGGETFVVSLSALKSEWSFALARLNELLRDPNYTQEAFTKIQTQSIGSLVQKQSDFDYLASNGLKSLLFEGTAREHPFDGTVASLQDITLEDIRNYITAHIGRENLIVVIGGDLDEGEVTSAVLGICESLGAVSVPEILRVNTRKEPKEISINAKTEQAYLYFGAPYHIAYDSDEVYLGKVASFVLGSSGFGSRLMEEIRVNRGLAYSAYANLTTNKTSSYLSGHLQTKLESAEEAKRVVRELLSEFVLSGITEDELQSAKQFLQGSEPLRTETLQQRIGRAFNEYYSGKELGYSSKELKLIDKIKLDEMNSFIKRHTEIAELSFFSVTNSMTN